MYEGVIVLCSTV